MQKKAEVLLPTSPPPIKVRGRQFSQSDLQIIRECVSESYDKGRTKISRDVCVRLNWRQPNGWLKDRACRDVLIQLEARGFIELPPKAIKRQGTTASPKVDNRHLLSEYDLLSPMTEFPSSIDLQFAKGNRLERIWNELIREYHYLGCRTTVGKCIKYLIWADSRLVGAIAFSSPAWRLAPRDQLLKTVGVADPHEQVINNSRFLVLPFVRIHNLASHVLALTTRRIVPDWAAYYSVTPLAVETFVQPSLYDGTCYRAANWMEVGTTKGFAKRGAAYRNSQEPKRIFLYGLDRRMRRNLRKALQAQSDAQVT